MSDSTKSNTTTNDKPDTEERLVLPKSRLGEDRIKPEDIGSQSRRTPPKHQTTHKGMLGNFSTVHPDIITGWAALVETGGSRKEQIYYIPDKEIAEELFMLDAKIRSGSFALYQTRSGTFGVDFISDSDDPWTKSRWEGMAQATTSWVMIRNLRNEIDGYTVKALPPNAAPIKWPDDIDALFLEIMKGRIITSMDHPAAKKIVSELFGEVAGSASIPLHSTHEADEILSDED